MIFIVDYDLGWPLRFTELRRRLRHAIGPDQALLLESR
jgi:hypothetical protein